jgi:hypothetical protein
MQPGRRLCAAGRNAERKQVRMFAKKMAAFLTGAMVLV